MAKYGIYMPDSGMKIKMKIVIDDESDTNRGLFTRLLKRLKSKNSKKCKQYTYTEDIVVKEEE